MRRSNVAPAACLFIAAGNLVGCAAPTRDVTVDLHRILAREPVEPEPDLTPPSPPSTFGQIVEEIPKRAELRISDPSHASQGSMEATIEAQQQKALRTLERRLAAFYSDRVAEFAASASRALDKSRVAAYGQALDQIQAALQNYAAKRAPKITRLALLVGVPDPNPSSEPPKTALKPYLMKRFEETKQLRQDLAALDADFEAHVADILGKVTSGTSAEAADMTDRIAKFRDSLNRQAEVEARAQVPTSVKELGLKLVEPNPIFVPGIAERRAVIPAEAPNTPAPRVPSEGIPTGPTARLNLLEHELRIWLGLNRYRLAKKGKDVTEEFRTWRKTFRAGP